MIAEKTYHSDDSYQIQSRSLRLAAESIFCISAMNDKPRDDAACNHLREQILNAMTTTEAEETLCA